jgi:hypothetical protein
VSTSDGIEIVLFTKDRGPLTKQISLVDGQVKSDGSACSMAHGSARRQCLDGVEDLARLINRLDSKQAIALGAMRAGLPDEVEIVTKGKLDELNKLNGGPRGDVGARTATDIVYRNDALAFVLLDFDTKGMPREVAEKVAAFGGFWGALESVLPELASAARLVRRSTSAGLSRTDTGQALAGSDGLHAYIVAANGKDSMRFLTALHDRCWRAGLGWYNVSKSGAFLERSIVDRMVGGPEHLAFEGPPTIEPPLAQDAEARRPVVTRGDVVDTVAVCPSLSLIDQHQVRKLKAEAKRQLQPDALRAGEKYVAEHTADLVARTGVSAAAARATIERQAKGVLLPDVVLHLDAIDDPEMDLGGHVVTVGTVLDRPAEFEGFTLADPVEGIEAGRCKAKIFRGDDGMPFITSFVHGGRIYLLRYDARAVAACVEHAADPIAELARLAPMFEIDDVELKRLIAAVAARSPGVGVRAIADVVKSARAEHARRRAEAMRERKLAERTDPRPQRPRPDHEAEWLPLMATIDEVLGQSPDAHPPARDIDDDAVRARRVLIPRTHAFGSKDANPEGDEK